MTGPAVAVLLLVLFSVGMVAVLLVGLARNGMRLVRAVAAFAEQAMPVVDEIGAGADAAAQHAERLGTAAAEIRFRR